MQLEEGRKNTMRRRQLDPNFWLDEEMSVLNPQTRLLYMGLWGLCDDNYATFPDRPEWIKAQIFPYEKMDVAEMLKSLAEIKKLLPFEEDGKKYWFIKNFFKYQRVEKPSAPKYPKYPHPVGEDSPTTLQLLPRKIREDKGREEKITTLFEDFWKEYPNKTAKKKGLESWQRVFRETADVEVLFKAVMAGLMKAKKSSQWVKDDGRFVPHPTTWLNQERWNDEVKTTTEKKTHRA